MTTRFDCYEASMVGAMTVSRLPLSTRDAIPANVRGSRISSVLPRTVSITPAGAALTAPNGQSEVPAPPVVGEERER